MRLRPALLLFCALALAACDSSDPNRVAERGDRVEVTFEGRLEDGTVFNRRTTTTFVLTTEGNQALIPGFVDNVVGMRVGEEKTFTVPPEEGFGDRQRGDIPPNSTLVFDVELLDIR